MREAGIAYDHSLVRSGNFETDGGYEQAVVLLDRADRPSAIMCANDRTAIGVYYAAFQRGLRIPEDLSVVGYDDHVELWLAPHPPQDITGCGKPPGELLPSQWGIRIDAGDAFQF